MCTAISYNSESLYFGRTLDNDFSYSEEVTVTPRNFPLLFRKQETRNQHFAIIGMAYVCNNYPLYYDAMNEHGLCMAGLNFVGNAEYKKINSDKDNITHFELISWILCQSKTVDEAYNLLKRTNITDEAFSIELPSAQLHWIIADKEKAITVESVKEGLKIYNNPVGVLTNNPAFNEQIFALNNYMHLSAKEPKNTFSDKLDLRKYSRGMGALGLPGDLSSQSRFIRASFVKMNSAQYSTKEESISQFFHIMNTVEQPAGCCVLDNGKYEKTIYTSCCDTENGLYYYTTYQNRQITGINMNKENLNGKELIRFPLINSEQINMQN